MLSCVFSRKIAKTLERPYISGMLEKQKDDFFGNIYMKAVKKYDFFDMFGIRFARRVFSQDGKNIGTPGNVGERMLASYLNV